MSQWWLDNWANVLVSLGSGSLGVVVTLLLTGWWNYQNRKRERIHAEFEAATACNEAVSTRFNQGITGDEDTLVWLGQTVTDLNRVQLSTRDWKLRRLVHLGQLEIIRAHYRCGIPVESMLIGVLPRDDIADISRYCPPQAPSERAQTQIAMECMSEVCKYTNEMVVICTKKNGLNISPWGQFRYKIAMLKDQPMLRRKFYLD
ncbi:MAG: hypothetical protein SOW59_09745 [Corynebacterium sp.]|nr:hypothetical protein [Corynebacterium sp.]